MTSPASSGSNWERVGSWITSSFIADLIALDHLEDMVRCLCEQLRERTGAGAAAFLFHQQHLHKTCRLIYVCPEQRMSLFEQDRLADLCPTRTPGELPPAVADLPSTSPLKPPLVESGIRTLVRIPIRSGEELIGTLVVMDPEDPAHAPDLLDLFRAVGPAIGLTLHNCMVRQELEQQKHTLEQQVRLRAAELEKTNCDLADSRRAALNMMEDAILAQDQMAFQNELFQSFMDSLSAPVFFKDCDGHLLSVNRAYAKWLGKTPDDLQGRTAFDLFPEHIGEKILQDDRRIMKSGRAEEFEQEIGGHWWLTTKAPRYDQSGALAGIYGILWDISDRKLAEDELRKVSSEQSLILNNSTFGIALVRHRVFEWVNPRLAEMLGRPTDQIRNCATRLLYRSDEEYMQISGRAREVLGANKLFDASVPVQRSDGSVFWCRVSGKALDADSPDEGSIWMFEDISEKKEAEDELKRLSTAIEQSPEAVVITDLDAVIEYVNPAFEHITGYAKKEVLGKKTDLLKSGRHDDSFYRNLWETIESGHVWEGRLVNKRKDGSLYTEDATIAPVRDPAGKIINYVAVERDVTEELIREQQFHQAQKMQALGQLVGGVAHDFNNLLQIINGQTELAIDSLGPEHGTRANLQEVATAGELARDLVRQLLAFSRQQVIDPADIDLNEAVANNKKMLSRMIGEDVEFKFIAGKDLRPVFLDKGQLQQVLMNLCVNARDAMPDGGTLTIETENSTLGRDHLRPETWLRPGDYVHLRISDTGCGMDAATCSQVFEPFFTTKEVGAGTGLGLSTVYGIIKQNKGDIEVSSKPGEGTVFDIFLPAAAPEASADRERAGSDAGAAARGAETILIAEDDAMILDFSVDVLRRAGYRVFSARDGAAALQLFEEHAEEIDLVMADMVMPRMGGKEAVDQMLKKRPALRYLFVSGYVSATGQTSLIQDLGDHLLSKPYKISVLLKKIRDILDAG